MRTKPISTASMATIAAITILSGCAGQGNSTLTQNPTYGGTRGTNPASPSKPPISPTQPATPYQTSDSVTKTPGTPTIYINPATPEDSLIIATDSTPDSGALYVFDLKGKQISKTEKLDQPTGLDIEYGFKLDNKSIDIAITTESKSHRLRIFSINPQSKKLTDVSGNTDFLPEQESASKECNAVALYKRSQDGTIYAIFSPKSGPKENHLTQYQLIPNGEKIDLKLIRRFGNFSGQNPEGQGQISALFVDDTLGHLYASDELAGIRKYNADPDAKDANKELAFFGQSNFQGKRQGIALAETIPGQGYILVTDQMNNGSAIRVFPRIPTGPQKDHQELASIPTKADATNGIAATMARLTPDSPRGILIIPNTKDRNFHFYDLRKFLQSANL